MAEVPLPIIYKASSRVMSGVFVVGVILTAVGALTVFVPEGNRLVGGSLFGIGLMFTALAAISLTRGCPRLELDYEGIHYNRCLLGAKRVRWIELHHVDIQRVRQWEPIGEVNLDCLLLVTTYGRRIVISAPIDASRVEEVRDTIIRVAARFGSVRSAD